ncbi:putative phosphoesterase [Fulvivirga imtechensis AK7]|uniref:Putative phosphoesterase n=1 Tax=Fulvivirga imtechensis AK7 TaxID=1237149 RepID=L8JVY0_9BACT|nr:metallophosphoesterase [Fulvivirga imtechensis]ELR72353.1 putative phosphoesterase [Fulvivirga imtechensis AK7]
MNKILVILALLAVLVFVDWYVYQGIGLLTKGSSAVLRNSVKYTYWGITAITFGVILLYNFGDPEWFRGQSRSLIFTGIFINYFSKVFAILFLFADDLIRLGKWIASLFQNPQPSSEVGKGISRSDFLVKTAIIAGTVPLLSMSWGIISGAHDYRIRRKTIYLPNLPKAFDGIQIGQLSDIHSGSFFNKTAVKGGVEMLMKEKPDVVFFTGDLVNNETEEVKEYIDIFKKVNAPLGVYSTTGNHDYGEYRSWPSVQAKNQNFVDLKEAHRLMGYDLLMNENRMLKVDGEQIAVLGIENWGTGRFPKYGKMDEAYKGTEEAPVKLLLSHDPSHWDAQVRPNYPDIDLMFAGHTHGFQFGIEIGDFKWSPSQYAYKQWAGMYTEGKQHLYVNRGFGYIGYPGRIGMPPEITLITLKKA